MSVLILSVMLAAALSAVGASRKGQVWNSDRLRAHYLASDLMTEILDRPYAAPGDTPAFGPAPSEVATGRSSFDDIDDYHGLVEQPPKDRNGNPIPGCTNWRREVRVAWVSPANLGSVLGSDGGLKRITVTVSRKGVILAELVTIRCSEVTR